MKIDNKKFAIRDCLGNIHSHRSSIDDKMRFNVRVNPLSSIVMKSRRREAVNGYISIDKLKK